MIHKCDEIGGKIMDTTVSLIEYFPAFVHIKVFAGQHWRIINEDWLLIWENE